MKRIAIFALGIILVGGAMWLLSSCAQMSPNDGLVPRMSAQANLPGVPQMDTNGNLSFPLRASSGSAVSPLAETRKAYWSTP
jgi:hypothetical protein